MAAPYPAAPPITPRLVADLVEPLCEMRHKISRLVHNPQKLNNLPPHNKTRTLLATCVTSHPAPNSRAIPDTREPVTHLVDEPRKMRHKISRLSRISQKQSSLAAARKLPATLATCVTRQNRAPHPQHPTRPAAPANRLTTLVCRPYDEISPLSVAALLLKRVFAPKMTTNHVSPLWNTAI